MTSLHRLSAHLLQNKQSLASHIVEGVLNKMRLSIPQKEKEEALSMYIDFFEYLGDAILREKEEVLSSLIQWSKKNAEVQVSFTGNISHIIIRYPPTREVLTDLMTQLSQEFELSLSEFGWLMKQTNCLLDLSVCETVYAFEHFTKKFQVEAQKELAKVSTPIVPVKEGVVILPLIGNIDAYRAGYIMEHVLPMVSELGTRLVIADFSGVLKLDKENVHHLHQIGGMLRLMGIKVISTGIRPQLAQLAVASGVDLSRTNTYATLQKALESLE